MGNEIRSSHEFAEIIKGRRKQLNLTQYALSARAKMHQGVISRIELGQRDMLLSTATHLLDILGLMLIVVPKPGEPEFKLERDIPKKPEFDYYGKAICPTCKLTRLRYNECCPNNQCRQAIDWSKDE